MFKSLLVSILLSPQLNDSIELVDSPEIIETAADLRTKEKYQTAIDLYSKVLPIDSNYFKIQSYLLETYNEAKQYKQSIILGEKLVKEHHEYNANVFINLGNAYLNLPNLEKAKETYERGRKLFPYNHILIYNSGINQYRLKDYENAIISFQQTIRLNPYYSSAHLMLGYLSVLQGHRTKAVLSYLTYLAIDNSNNSVLIRVNNLVNDALRYEGSIDPIIDNFEFEYYDRLSRSKAALDERFNFEVKLDAPVTKQLTLLFSKLQHNPNSDDFWMQYYVPIFTKIHKVEGSNAFIYFILKSSNNEDVAAWLEKNDDKRKNWVSAANSILVKNRSKLTATVGNNEGQYSFWYYNSNRLSAIGNQINDDLYIGPWEFFSENSQLNAKGSYNQEGYKIGKWYYYYDNGRLKRTEGYDADGNVSAPEVYYREDGSQSMIAHYNEENNVHGFLEFYYPCGQIKEKYPYNNGKKEGNGTYYFNTGELELEYTIADGELEGKYTKYYTDGQVMYITNYSNGLTDGEYISYHNNGSIDEKGFYKNDSAINKWTGYYNNGQLRYNGTFSNDKKVGQWQYYYKNGMLKEESQYNNVGDLDGLSKYYDHNGILSTTETYKEGLFIGYTYLKKNGDKIHSEENKEGNMPFRSFYSTGQKKAEGEFMKGEFNGSHVTYHRNGKLWQEGTMKNGYWDGSYKEFYNNGVLKIRSTYTEGEFNGYYELFHKNGSKQQEGFYVANTAQQLWKTYFSNGTLSEVDYFKDGNLEGLSQTFAVDGRLYETMLFKDGIQIANTKYDTLGKVLSHNEFPNGNGTNVYHYSNGQKKFENKLVCGNYVTDQVHYFPSGKILSKSEIKHSRLNGKYESYFQNGNIKVAGEYEQGSGIGNWMYYGPNKILEANYEYSDDVRNGKGDYYNDDGQLETSCQYVDGEKHGPCKYYDPAGKLQLVKYYDKEEGFYAYSYEGKGRQLSDTIWVDNKNDLQLNSFFQDGSVAVSQTLKDGTFNGENVYYHTNGQIMERIEYKDGDNHGKRLEYYSNGQLSYSATYVDDLLEGEVKKYFSHGQLKEVTTYLMGEENGPHIRYDEDGNIVEKLFYWNGELY
ncbi:MAG: hypothetical protein JXQ96_20500 [Cyclobacteriaceae bacterium]